MKQFLAVASMLFATVFWGSTFILVKWTIAEIDLYYFLCLRFLLAFLIIALLFSKQLFKADVAVIRSAFILSLYMFAVYAFQTEGLKTTSASNSALITGLYLVLIPFFSALFFKERARLLSVVGAAVALVGLYLLTRYSWTGFNFGDFLTLLCAIAGAGHIIMTGKYTHKHKVLQLVIFQFLFMAIFCAIGSVIKSGITLHLPKIAVATIIITAIFSTVLAFIVQTWAQRIVDPTRTGIIFAMESVFGVIFAYLLGGETLTRISFIGACLMVAGMIISEIHPLVAKVFAKK